MPYSLRSICAAMLLCSFVGSVSLGQETATLHSAIKPVPRDADWIKQRHAAINARVKEGNVDLVFIGDSITQGWEGPGRKIWEQYYANRNAVNLGISGDRTEHVIWRLDNGNLEGVAPKAAVIMIGTNNSGSNSPEEIAEGVTTIVRQVQEESPDTKILLLATFPRGADSTSQHRQVNEKSNEIVAKLADDDQVFFLDIGEKFLDEEKKLSREIMPDFLHLSEKGYTIWAEAIESKLADLMGE